MTSKIFLSQFNADLVTSHFNVATDRPEELAAMRFMFKMMMEELPANLGRSRAGLVAAELTIQKITFRYNLFKKYVEDFFDGQSNPDIPALCLAAICDEYINSANDPRPEAEGETDALIQRRNNGIDESVLIRACYLWEKACQFEGQGIVEHDNDIASEAVFLAHIHALENLRDLEELFHGFEQEELEKILHHDFPCLEDFICPHTNIGAELQGCLNSMKDRIDKVVYPPAPKIFHLRLVTLEGPS